MIAIESRTARAQSARIAAVDVVHDLDAAEMIWRSLENSSHSITPFQRFDFLAPWQREVGERAGLSPFIVIARDGDGQPRGLLPLALQTALGVRRASFMGGEHATFNMGLWERGFALGATKADLHAFMAMLAKRDKVDVLALRQQPAQWRGVQNPLALLPHEPLVLNCPMRTIEPGATAANLIGNPSRRMKLKQRKLLELTGYRYHVASTDADIARLLDWFFRVKSERLAERKVSNVFAERAVEKFIRAACTTRLSHGDRVIEIHALECDEEVIAIFALAADGHRFSTMFNTYTLSDNAKFSPGLLLMQEIIHHFAGQHYRAFDFGLGSHDYKRLFCKDDEPLFDSFIPLTRLGRQAAGVMSAVDRTKRLVEHHPKLRGVAQRLRKALLDKAFCAIPLVSWLQM
ncbi:GNAT family N-acetyltransferase [Bradyrhizobium brasilense]|uniref:GNAT family N-acetyltransferase n=1 Tax=Bradyrhizobium brasilense TaxID=1419277 RepID=UPI0024B112E2|nr:GNAT family N-acetyltransferase [Bradyrhizobium australafricanum]WFU33007.1 GNAT family N-acetyltransferase [Bradyrhizobium australafricanum]